MFRGNETLHHGNAILAETVSDRGPIDTLLMRLGQTGVPEDSYGGFDQVDAIQEVVSLSGIHAAIDRRMRGEEEDWPVIKEKPQPDTPLDPLEMLYAL